MNDFTLEELESIAYALKMRGSIQSDLQNKVDWLINNYDDHQLACEAAFEKVFARYAKALDGLKDR